MRRLRRRDPLALLASTALTFGAMPPGSARADIALLYVSYDPTRGFYRDFNKLFAEHWKEQTSEDDQQISPSHGPCRGGGIDDRPGRFEDRLVADHHTYDIDVATLQVATGTAWVPWRTSYSPLIQQMKCYTKPLKCREVRPQFLSLRQHI
jgi:ABC-type sulfate transport system substrate-binding protein